MSRIETWTKRKALTRRIRQLWQRLPRGSVPERVERYTALDNALDIEAEALVVEIENASTQALAKPKQKRNKLEAALALDRLRESWRREEVCEAEERLAAFRSRFGHAVEQLTKIRAAWAVAGMIVVAVLCDFPLTYLGLSFITPDVGSVTGLPGPVGWLLSNLALIAAVGVTLAIALTTKACGREAAWASHPAIRDLTQRAPEEGKPVIYSDWTRRSHRIAFGVLTVALVAVVVGLVLLREPAITLLASLTGGGGAASGVAAPEAAQDSPSGAALIAGLLAVSGFPLIVAAWLSYLRESPLRERLAALEKDVASARAKLADAIEARRATEAELANLGVVINAILAERDMGQVVARLTPHLGHEVMVEAQPELFGAVSGSPHPLRWPAEKLAGPFPQRNAAASEWFVATPESAPSTNGSGSTSGESAS